MDLRQVEYVVGVVDHGGFGRAARALHVAQPSLSQGIRRLEAELGTALFSREERHVALTPAGRAFLGPARQLLRDVAVTRAAVRPFGSLDEGVLDVVALPTLVTDPLVPALARFRASHPGVVVRIEQPETTAAVAELVREGDCELGLTELTPETGGLQRVPLARQVLHAVRPPGTPRPRRHGFDLTELAHTPLIAAPPGTSARDLVDDAFRRLGLSPSLAVQTTSREAVVPLVLAHVGTAFLPAPLARAAAAAGAVTGPVRPRITRTVGLLHRRTLLSPAAAAFVDVIVSSP